MLEVKNLTKIYSGKGGVSVKALDDVSVQFPEKGMVFLLGRSGSGKSTLLNVAGGLDKPDGGEVIVKGKSSKEFSSSDFDSYRNTFIGFVFQEYNILNEFTIEQNIALALQLQSKPNDKQAVAALLEKVDLAGFAKRKPNTLSGGQKQRVAIARALIKEPEIIMADEPTGALDSTTGKQVLDTLKKLSQNKLVIVVSHDRDFAEHYGDRIIELKDGKIISDVSKVCYAPTNIDEKSPEETVNVSMISDDTISIKNGKELTDADVRKIAEMLRKNDGEALITTDKHDMPNVKRACRINEQGEKESFKDTKKVDIKEYDGTKTKFIKSRLPLGHAIKMGASGLKTKPIRLIFTILLTVATFILFGVMSTFMLYDPNYSISEAMKEASYPALVVSKSYDVQNKTYVVKRTTLEKTLEYEYTNQYATRFGESELESRSKNGLSYAGIFDFTDNTYASSDRISLTLVNGTVNYPVNVNSAVADYYGSTSSIGFSDCSQEYMTRSGFSLVVGAHPSTEKEVAITSYMADLFINTDGNGIDVAQDLIGKKIRFSTTAISAETFTISGIYNVGTIDSKFDALKPNPQEAPLANDKKEELASSFSDYLQSSFHLVTFVTPEFYEAYKDNLVSYSYNDYYMETESYGQIQMSEYGPFTPESAPIGWIPMVSCLTEETLRIYGTDAVKFYNKNNDTVSFDPNEMGVYLSERKYFDMRRSNLSGITSSLINYLNYVKEAKDEYDGDEFQVLAMTGVNESTEEKYAEFLIKWGPKVAYRYYLLCVADYLSGSGDVNYDSSSEFYTKTEKIRNSIWGDNSSVESEWEYIESAINAEQAHESIKYAAILRTLRECLGFWGKVFGTENEDSILNEHLVTENYSATELQEKKNAIDAFMQMKGLGLIASQKPFSMSKSIYSVENQSVYYLDMNNIPGELPILGYFTSYAYCDYFIPKTFMDAHGLAEEKRPEIRITENTSEYDVPKDAKYNFLISKTDCSMGQIATMLSSEKDTTITLRNNVYYELQMFLELIEDLEKIFLYVGLGVGVLAAFFLLNFISVSISVKKRDIGVLRAVGARGSDVFKIFYAESFIITIICFILAIVGSFILCFELNKTISDAISLQLLRFGPINIALELGIAVVVSVIATFFPVYFAAKKSPVEAIRSL